MEIKRLASSAIGQDGAVYGDLLFRFDADGSCRVQDLTALDRGAEVLPVIAEFKLDKAELLPPHSNATVFGSAYAAPGDEFPLLYSNIYNNREREDDPLLGTLCVYRLEREGDGFQTTLLQLIQLGFTHDPIWCSEGGDVRPYGNLVIDREQGKLYAFTMRDGDRTSRYFALRLPEVTEGEIDSRFGVRRVTLAKEDIEEYFDTPYHNYIQGACMEGGLIYSVEGFDYSEIAPAALRIIDPAKKAQVFHFSFGEAGYDIEPECIDFRGKQCLYSDARGNLFELTF